jgi:hypothetical protein
VQLEECGGIVFAPADRRAPRALDEVEQGGTALLADHVADERAQQAHLVPQRDVFGSELNGAARRCAHAS